MRLAVVTNILTPYSIAVYNEMATSEEVVVLVGGNEDNRLWQLSDNWRFRTKRVFDLVIKRSVRHDASSQYDSSYSHLPLGVLPALMRLSPDAVISGEMGLRSLFAWMYCLLRGKPLTIHWEGTCHTQRNVSRMKKLLRRTFFARMARNWIACGSESKRYLTTLGIPESHIEEAYYCIDNTAFSKPAKATVSAGPRPVLLYTGQFIRRKGLHEFIEAVALAQEKGLEFSTLLVGSGPEEEALVNRVRSLDLRNVMFHPFVQPQELPGIYQSADVYVFPTLSDGWGVVVNEALATGLPVLCSKYAGCAPDLVPETWQFDPLQMKESFLPKLEMAISTGRKGRKEFLSVSKLMRPSQAAKIMSSVSRKVRVRQ